MNEGGSATAGTRPIQPLLAQIAKITDAKSLTAAIAALHAAGYSAVFDLSPVQDSADARNVIAGIDQAGLGLPDRDYYLNDDDTSKKLRPAYIDYVPALLQFAGRSPAIAKQPAA